MSIGGAGVSAGGDNNIDLNAILAGGPAFLARLQDLKSAEAAANTARHSLRDREAEVEKILAAAQVEAERIVSQALGKAAEIAKAADERTSRAEAARDQALAAIEKLEALGKL